jgi:tetratricopeptide (TPR) repeat protein
VRRRVDHSLRGLALGSALLFTALAGRTLAQGAGASDAPAAAPASPTPPAAPTTAPASPAAAAPATPAAPAAPPTAEQQAAAREAYGRGQAAFSSGRFAEARAAFGEAFAAVANPVVLLPIAEAETSLGELAAARKTLLRYLELRPDAPDRAEVEKKIAELDSHPGRVAVASAPAGARLRVDGVDRSEVTPTELELPVGEHRIEVILDRHEHADATVSVEPAARQELSLKLVPMAPVPLMAATPSLATAVPADEPALKDETQVPTTALWVCGIVAASGLITGTVLGFLALEEHSEFQKEPTVESADRGEKLALFADVSFALGGMALITGAVLWLTASDAEPTPAKAAPSARLQITPLVGPGQVAASARVKF